MADYLDPIIWSRRSREVVHYSAGSPPSWLPEDSTWQGGVKPKHFLLIDPAGEIRQIGLRPAQGLETAGQGVEVG